MARKREPLPVGVKYKAAPGSHLKDADAEIIMPEIRRIQQRDGMVKPKIMVDEARAKSAPLHRYFEWNNSIAAEEYRLEQARLLQRSVIEVNVVVERGETREIDFRSTVHVVDPEMGRGYVTMDVAVANDDYRGQMLDNAKRDLVSLKQKYGRLREVVEAVDAALLRLG